MQLDKKKYAAIVTVHPGSSCKEQTSGIYPAKLAEEGFVTLAIDASYQGESGGEPRYIEDPAARMEDIRSAIDFLVTLPYVNAERIGALGVCAGGYVVNVAMTERRIKAVSTLVGANIGGIYRGKDTDTAIKLLEQIGRERTAEAQGAEPLIIPWVAEEYKEAENIDLLDAYQYYLTPCGQHSNSPNKLRFISLANVLAFDLFNMVSNCSQLVNAL